MLGRTLYLEVENPTGTELVETQTLLLQTCNQLWLAGKPYGGDSRAPYTRGACGRAYGRGRSRAGLAAN